MEDYNFISQPFIENIDKKYKINIKSFVIPYRISIFKNIYYIEILLNDADDLYGLYYSLIKG